MKSFLISSIFVAIALGKPIGSELLAARDTYPKIETKLSSKPNFINFGSIDPVEGVVGALNDHCNDYECNTEYTVQSRYASKGGAAGSITIKAEGSWVDTADGHNPRDYLIDALKKVVGANIQTHNERIPPTGHGSSGIVIEHNALSNSGVTRSVTQQAGFQPAEQGDLSITVSLDSAGAGDCGKIGGALTALAGEFSGGAAAFFGVVSAGICSIQT